MSVLRTVLSLLRGPAARARREGDLDGDVRTYLDLLVEEKIAAGAEPAAARRAALAEVGGVEQVKESVRDVRAGALAETVLQDVRFAWRSLVRRPLFLAVSVTALALGIGANTAIFSVVNAVLLRPLPYRDPGRIVVLLHRNVNPVAPANYLDWRSQSRSFQAMEAAEYWTPNITGGDRPESVDALRVTPGIFPLLGVPPLLGRVLTEEAGRAGGAREVVLGYPLWQRVFGGDRGIVGRTIRIDGEPYTVVGVMPATFRFAPFWATRAALWAPIALESRATNRDGNSLRVFARLKPGVGIPAARAELAGITARLEREYPGTNRDVTLTPLKEKVVGDVRPALLVLSAAVGFVLLIACANVAHMLLARAAARRKEVVVRMALGAGRGRLLRQFLTESILLAFLGGAAGLLLAMAATRTLVAASDLPGVENVRIEPAVLLFLTAISLCAGILFGLVPALQSTRGNPATSLREAGRGSEVSSRRGFRTVLMASEFALALVLLVGAGLMIRSFVALQAIDPGFDPRGVLTLRVSVAGTGQAGPARRTAFYREILQRIEALPGVESAAAINHLPLAGDIWGWPFQIEGRPAPKPGESPNAAYRVVFPGYFRTMGLPLLRGRDFGEQDRRDSPGVVIVNEYLAAKHWPGEDAIGKRITLGTDPDGNPIWLTVVGITKNAVREQWADPAEEELYRPFLQTAPYMDGAAPQYAYLTFVVRTAGNPAAIAPAVRSVIRASDAQVPVSEVATMEQVVSESNARPRFYLLLLGTFAAVAVVLAAVGIYGVMSYSVSRRKREIGIRMALGAERRTVVRLIVGEGLSVALAGAAAGLAGAFALTRLMSRLLYGVRPTDPVTFAAVPVVLTLVAVAASYLPARRATRIDPMAALRNE